MNSNIKRNRKTLWLLALVALVAQAGAAQVLTGDQAKKLSPNSYYFAGQSAAVQARNTVGLSPISTTSSAEEESAQDTCDVDRRENSKRSKR